MNPLALVGLGALGLIALLARRHSAPPPPPAPAGPWRDARWNRLALPVAGYPISSAADLYTAARLVVGVIRAHPDSPGLWTSAIADFQKKAGLVARGTPVNVLDPNTGVTAGAYDAVTRTAVGGFGGFTVEETP
jgi:hypothetical protein